MTVILSASPRTPAVAAVTQIKQGKEMEFTFNLTDGGRLTDQFLLGKATGEPATAADVTSGLAMSLDSADILSKTTSGGHDRVSGKFGGITHAFVAGDTVWLAYFSGPSVPSGSAPVVVAAGPFTVAA